LEAQHHVLTLVLGLALARCGDDPIKVPAATTYPAGGSVGVGSVLPNLLFEGVDERTVAGTIHLADYYEPAAAAPHLLVVRVEGGVWCGTCRWHAAHTGELLSGERGSRLRVLDLVIGNRDNAPASTGDIGEWRALVDTPVATAVDPSFSLRALFPTAGAILPLFVFVDTKTMRIISQSPNPNPVELSHDVDTALATIDGRPAPPPPAAEVLVDGVFHRNEWEMLHDVTTPGAPPADPTNAAADSTAAAALGRSLFFDQGLSPSGRVACATCHDPQKQLSDGLPQSKGLALGTRRTPRIALAAFSRWQFWDGRADSQWAQALGPLENEDEMGSSRVYVVQRVAASFASSYQAAFPGDALPDVRRLPSEGKPGAAAYDSLSDADQDAVTRAFVNVGKAIAAFERTFRARPSRLDAYAAGDFTALAPLEKQGLSVFLGVGCMQCHWGPRLTDDAFHVTRTPTGRRDGQADNGRADGLAKLSASEFRASSKWSDAEHASTSFALPNTSQGAFKTPSLRGVASGAPYGHGGEQPTLIDVMTSYGTGGTNDASSAGLREPWLTRFPTTAQWSIAAFLNSAP
jgi:cytochrome c peroxidase